MNTSVLKRIKRILLPLISGILTGASAYFPILNCLIFVSAIPLFISVLQQSRSRKAVKSVLLYGAGYYPIILLWFYNLMPERHEPFHIFTVTTGIIIFSTLQTLWLCASIFPFVFIRTQKPQDVFIFSFLYILGEWFQEIIPLFSFPWGRLSAVFTSYLPWIQSASLFGNLFLSFLVLCINGFIAWIISCKNKKEIFQCAMALLLLAAGNLSFGYFRLSFSEESPENTAVSFISGENSANVDSPLIILIGKRKEAIQPTLNSTVIFWNSENKEPLDVIVPQSFSEENAVRFRMPYENEIPFENFSRGMGIGNGFTKKRGVNVSKTTLGTVGGIFCYETVYPQKLRKTVRQGADFIVAFCDERADFKAFPAVKSRSEAILRAIEAGKPVLLADGDSPMIISKNGRIQLPALNDGAFSGSFHRSEGTAIYSAAGDLIVIPSLIFWISGIIRLRNSRRKSKEKRN